MFFSTLFLIFVFGKLRRTERTSAAADGDEGRRTRGDLARERKGEGDRKIWLLTMNRLGCSARSEEVGGGRNRRRRPRGIGDGILDSRRITASRQACFCEKVEEDLAHLLV